VLLGVIDFRCRSCDGLYQSQPYANPTTFAFSYLIPKAVGENKSHSTFFFLPRASTVIGMGSITKAIPFKTLLVVDWTNWEKGWGLVSLRDEMRKAGRGAMHSPRCYQNLPETRQARINPTAPFSSFLLSTVNGK